MEPTENQRPREPGDAAIPADEASRDEDVLNDFRKSYERTQTRPAIEPSPGLMERLRRLGRLGFRGRERQKEHESDVFEAVDLSRLDVTQSIEWVAENGPPYGHFNRFELQDMLGHGTSAYVFRAFDSWAKQTIALKIGKSHLMQNVTARARFDREARLASDLRHPQIVRVLEFGEHKQHPFMVMEYCQGSNLAEWAEQHPRGLTIEQGAQVVRLLADAVAHAQQHGVVHRDIKPENVLLDEAHPVAGLPFNPKLADFGVAAVLNERSLSASTGSLIGTAHYIPPEQINRGSSDLTLATDVYGLGTVLYFLLVGEPPVGRTDARTALLRTLLGNIPAVRDKHPNIPARLAEICDSCLRRQPQLRCPSAKVLAEDLCAFIEHRRPKWRAHRILTMLIQGAIQPRVSWLTVGLMSLVILVLFGGCLALFNVVTNLQQDVVAVQDNATHIERQSLVAQRHLEIERHKLDDSQRSQQMREYETNFTLLRYQLEAHQFEAAQRRFTDQAAALSRASSSPRIATGIEWPLMSLRLQTPPVEKLIALDTPQHCIALDPQHQQVAIAGADGAIRLFSASISQTSALPHLELTFAGEQPAEQSEINSIAFARHSNRLATVGDDGTLAVWDRQARQLLARHTVMPVECHHVVFVNNDQHIACAAKRGHVEIIDPQTGLATGQIKHVGEVLALAAFKDGQRLIVGGSGPIQIWDVPSNKLSLNLSGHEDRVTALAVSQDERILVSTGRDQVVCVWDLESGKLLGQQTLPQRPSAVAIAPSQDVCVIGTFGGALFPLCLPHPGCTLLEAVPELPPSLPIHRREIYSLAFAPDGRSVITASRDGSACLVRSLLYDRPLPNVPRKKQPIRQVREFQLERDPVPSQLLVVLDDGLEIWDSAGQQLVERRDLSQTEVRGKLLNAIQRRDRVIAVTDHGEIVQWSPSGTIESVRRTATNSPQSQALNPHSGWAYFVRDAHRLSVFDWLNGRSMTNWAQPDCQRLVWSPDGTLLAIVDSQGVQVRSWPEGTLKMSILIEHGPASAVQFYESHLAIISDRLRLHSLSDSGQTLAGESPTLPALDLQMASRSTDRAPRLLSCDGSAAIRIWSLETANQLAAHPVRSPVSQLVSTERHVLYLDRQTGQLRQIELPR